MTTATTSSSPLAIEVKVLDEQLHKWGLPKLGSAGSAGFDLRACLQYEEMYLMSGECQLISTGLAVHIKDPNYAMLLLPRSGLGAKSGVVLGNLVGLVDSDYQGPVMLAVWNRNMGQSIRVKRGDRIAQAIFVPVVRPMFEVVEEFTADTERGVGGIGSTGV